MCISGERLADIRFNGGYVQNYLEIDENLKVMVLYLIVPFWYHSTAYQVNLLEPWFVFSW